MQKKNDIFELNFKLSNEEINKIDDNIDIDELMKELYKKYLNFQKIENYDTDLDELLTYPMKYVCTNIINNLKMDGCKEVIDDIQLINYFIIEYSKDSLRFIINISCLKYKKKDIIVINIDNLKRYEIVLNVLYSKINNNWIIKSISKPYEEILNG